jgi:MFS family permease
MAAPPLSSRRALVVLCLVSAGWAFSFGLGAPLASLWLHDHGGSDSLVGLNTGVYYLGIAVAAAAIPGLMRRWGSGCLAAGMAASGATVILFPWAMCLSGEFVLRLLNGFAGAMSLIPLETSVNRDSPPKHRSRNFGFYAVAITLGWALGNLVGLQMYPSGPRLAFGVGGAVALLAGIGVLWLPRAAAQVEEKGRGPLDLGRSFLGLGTAWGQGFLEGGMVGFLSLYLLSLGMTEGGVSWVTSGVMVGVILFQVPVAWLADRLGRTPVLLGCYAVVIAGLTLLPFCGNSAWLTVWLFLVGACSGAFYPLGLAMLGERVPACALARANAWFLAMNCVGSLTGPVLMGFAMDWAGERALFAVGEVAVVLVLVAWVFIRRAHPQQGEVLLATEAGPDLNNRRAA